MKPKIKRKLWDIWRDNFNGIAWAVQFPKGILHFQTKKIAESAVKAFK